MKYKLKEGRVPSNLNIDELINNIERNETYKQFVKDGMVYFLSLLCIDEEYPDHMVENGYIILNDKMLQEVIGKGGKTSRTATIKNILKYNKIIDCLPYDKKKKSYSFRLNENYNTGCTLSIEFSERISGVLAKINSTKTSKQIAEELLLFDNDNKEYPHLIDQFNVHDFSVDHNLLKAFLLAVVDKSTDYYADKKYTNYSFLSLFSFIGKSLKLLTKLEERSINFNSSENNHRFYNGLTNLPKVLRQFLFINGKEIGEVDMSACQVYIFASILNPQFCSSESDSEYHINNIYPKLMHFFKNLDIINFSRKPGNTNYVLGEYFNDNDKKEIEEFSDFDFANKDFYSSLAEDIFKKETDLEVINDEVIKLNRNSVKKSIMNILFNSNEIHRGADRVNRGFETKYPQVDNFITLFHRLYTSRDFAILLQRCEAFIVLEKATFNILENHPTAPIFTIHDCIITTMDHIKLVEYEMVKEIEELTKKKVGVKSEQISFHRQSPNETQIDEILLKHKITSKSLNKKLININESNIDLAVKYLYGDNPVKLAEWNKKLKRSIQT
ncbi:hypothetical protein GENT5_03940 [Flavobacterium ammoniigenes]|uniref:Uncharacterized protein n=1 Tax=Flavobacterium ammoniigenes TaxID=1751095 RepID=A0ABM7V3L4_9FLAO|nr:hypothetical protein [Flavobacterium ammoniigenes]BDB54089.1 hypothetical protein GENT5_03940 [Flavobacterium ammoniigenes]